MKVLLYSDEQSGVRLGGPRLRSVPQQILHDPAVILGIFKPDVKNATCDIAVSVPPYGAV